MESAAADVASWGRLVMVRGDRHRDMSFRAGQPAKLVVGSGASASLCCQLPEVAPRQFDVVWDGANLWLEDALRLGRTFVNGKLLNEWVFVLGQALVAFGPVRLWLTAGGASPAGAAPDFAALERARLTDAHHGSDTRQRNTGRITLPPELCDTGVTQTRRAR
jgi:hypothetical protein